MSNVIPDSRKLRLSKFCHFFEKNDVTALFNSLSLDVVFMSSDVADDALNKIKQDKISEQNNGFWEKLRKAGILVNVDFDEKAELSNVAQKTSEQEFLTVLYLVLTDYCNLKCSYCFIETPVHKKQSQLYKGSGNMTKEIAERAINLFSKLTMAHAPTESQRLIQLYGGEPLLNFPVIKYAVEHIEKLIIKSFLPKNTKIVLITNGVLATEEIAMFLFEHKIIVGISIDGTERMFNDYRKSKDGSFVFKKVINNFRLLKQYGVQVGASCTLSPAVVNNFEEAVEFLMALGVENGLAFNILHETPGLDISSEYYQKAADCIIKAFQLFRKKGIYEERFMRKLQSFVKQEAIYSDCSATGNQIVVAPDGRIGVCQDFIKVKKYFPASVYDDSWNPFNDSVFNEWRHRSPLNMEQCFLCPALGICGGGCPASIELASGSMWEIDKRICPHSIKTLEWLIWDLYEQME